MPELDINTLLQQSNKPSIPVHAACSTANFLNPCWERTLLMTSFAHLKNAPQTAVLCPTLFLCNIALTSVQAACSTAALEPKIWQKPCWWLYSHLRGFAPNSCALRRHCCTATMHASLCMLPVALLLLTPSWGKPCWWLHSQLWKLHKQLCYAFNHVALQQCFNVCKCCHKSDTKISTGHIHTVTVYDMSAGHCKHDQSAVHATKVK